MAEYIQKTDTLNEGREKLNEAIKDAEDAKVDSSEALSTANQALAKSDSTQTQLDTIVIDGDSSVEAAQARVDEKGESHATLKARIDDGFEKTAQQLADITDYINVTTKYKLDKTGNEYVNDKILQAINDYPNGTTFYFEEGTYLVNPAREKRLDFNSNTTLILNDNAIFEVETNDLSKYYIFYFGNKKNITVKGGTLLGDKDSHTGNIGEWGFGIGVHGCVNILIDGVTCNNFWGDGILVSRYNPNESVSPNPEQVNTKDIVIRNCVCDGNRRQGLSVASSINIIIENSVFTNTSGTLPSSGIDFEPDNQYDTIKNVVISNCLLDNNSGFGIQTAPHDNNSYRTVEGFKIVNCVITNNKEDGIQLPNTNDVFIQGCTIEKNANGVNIRHEGSFNVVIVNNNIKNNNLRGINGRHNKEVLITDNIIKGNKEENIYFDGSMLEGVIISDNVILHSILYGVHCSNLKNSNISNNNISECDRGVVIGAMKDTIVNGNIVKKNNRGFSISTSEMVTIINNTVQENAEIGLGIYDSNDLIINNNFISDNGHKTNGTYSGLSIQRCNGLSVQNNLVRKGEKYPNKQSYGIFIDSNSSNIVETNNNATSSGVDGDIRNDSQ